MTLGMPVTDNFTFLLQSERKEWAQNISTSLGITHVLIVDIIGNNLNINHSKIFHIFFDLLYGIYLWRNLFISRTLNLSLKR